MAVKWRGKQICTKFLMLQGIVNQRFIIWWILRENSNE